MSVLNQKRIFETGVWIEHNFETYFKDGQKYQFSAYNLSDNLVTKNP